MQIAKFLGGESSPLILEKDPSGVFITSLEVGKIKADSGDTYGCQPNPGVAAEVKVHVIKEGDDKILLLPNPWDWLSLMFGVRVNYLALSRPVLQI